MKTQLVLKVHSASGEGRGEGGVTARGRKVTEGSVRTCEHLWSRRVWNSRSVLRNGAHVRLRSAAGGGDGEWSHEHPGFELQTKNESLQEKLLTEKFLNHNITYV